MISGNDNIGQKMALYVHIRSCIELTAVVCREFSLHCSHCQRGTQTLGR